jgi:hypothetical protein
MNSKVLMILVVGLSSCHTLAEDQKTDTAVYKYPMEVIVTAPRMSIPLTEVPFSASVVDHNTLLKLPRAVSVDEALKMVPGEK